MSDNLKKRPLPTDAAELLALAKEEGVELDDKQLEAIAGGDGAWDDLKCFITCEECGEKIPCDIGAEFVYCPNCDHRNGPLLPL